MTKPIIPSRYIVKVEVGLPIIVIVGELVIVEEGNRPRLRTRDRLKSPLLVPLVVLLAEFLLGFREVGLPLIGVTCFRVDEAEPLRGPAHVVGEGRARPLELLGSVSTRNPLARSHPNRCGHLPMHDVAVDVFTKDHIARPMVARDNAAP